MKVVRAMVLLNEATDKVFIHTDLPSAFSYLPQDHLTLQFDTTYDKGADYVRENFGIEPEIVNTRRKNG